MISAIILTLNESQHIRRCIESIREVCEDIVVVDCFSTDDTVEIAKSLGARVYQNKWVNYATQFNYGVHDCDISSEWIWRVDADEYITPELASEVKSVIPTLSDEVTGIYVPKQIEFMGRILCHGGWNSVPHLKIFRRGHGECEKRWMDEHIRLFDGTAITINKGSQVDSNQNDLTWWTGKHNGYATREMVDVLMTEYNIGDAVQEVEPKFFGTSEQRKRWLKVKYIGMPLFLRPFVNFTYRYFFKLGFLDGREGFLWHILQGFWYRMLVDAKVYEIKKRYNFDKEEIIKFLQEKYLTKHD